jgi:hypothetical protein
MLKPTMKNQAKPLARLTTPSIPRLIGPNCALPSLPTRVEKRGVPARSSIRRPPVSSMPISGAPCT